jgi:hypothetical protein
VLGPDLCIGAMSISRRFLRCNIPTLRTPFRRLPKIVPHESWGAPGTSRCRGICVGGGCRCVRGASDWVMSSSLGASIGARHHDRSDPSCVHDRPSAKSPYHARRAKADILDFPTAHPERPNPFGGRWCWMPASKAEAILWGIRQKECLSVKASVGFWISSAAA